MKNIDKDGLLLSKIQGNIFLNSLNYTSSSTEVFIRRYMNSSIVETLDSKAFLDDSLTIKEVFKNIEEEYGKTSYGTNKYSKETLYWIGYIYRYMAYIYELSSKQVYNIIKPKELNERYYLYHTYDTNLAILNILEEKDISFDAIKLNKKLLSLLKTKKYGKDLIVELKNIEQDTSNFLFNVFYNNEKVGDIKISKFNERFYKLDFLVLDKFNNNFEFLKVSLKKIINILKEGSIVKELLVQVLHDDDSLIEFYMKNNFKYLKEDTKNVSLITKV
jgi:hypothetical protein